LRAIARRGGNVTFIPADIAACALQIVVERFAKQDPEIRVSPHLGRHESLLRALAEIESPKVVMFLGSSIGNYTAGEGRRLLERVRAIMGSGGFLLLGTDLRKSQDVLVRAYDDAAGVTSAFNKNLLRRINRELGGHFDLGRFSHVALWNAEASRVEMHLESTIAQVVPVDRLAICASFQRGERIHTESSVKFDELMVQRLLVGAGFRLLRSFYDGPRSFALHLATVQ